MKLENFDFEDEIDDILDDISSPNTSICQNKAILEDGGISNEGSDLKPVVEENKASEFVEGNVAPKRKVIDWGDDSDEIDDILDDISDMGSDESIDLAFSSYEQEKTEEDFDTEETEEELSEDDEDLIDSFLDDISEDFVDGSSDGLGENFCDTGGENLDTSSKENEKFTENIPLMEAIKKMNERIIHSATYTKFRIKNLHADFAWLDSPHIHKGQSYYTHEELGKERTDTYKEKRNPLVNEETNDLVVGQNGLTLGDYFLYKRAKKERNTLRRILIDAAKRNNISVEENPYVKSGYKDREKLLAVGKKVISEKRIGSSPSKFLQRYKKDTIYEKNIAKRLGLTRDDMRLLVSPKGLLTEEEKAKFLSVGILGTRAKPINKQYKSRQFLSVGDIEPMLFIEKVKYASTNNIVYATGRKIGSILWQLRKLERMGLLNNIVIYNSPGVWSLTKTGAAFLGSERKIPSTKQAGLAAVAERVYVNHVQALLFNGELNILNLPNFPLMLRLDEKGSPRKGVDFVTESDMLSAMSERLYDLKGGYFHSDSYKGESGELLRNDWETTWRKWELDGKKKDSPEFSNPWLFMLFYNMLSISGRRYVIPDIVVPLERNTNGTPNSIAVEVERKYSSIEDYKHKLMMYKLDNRVFSKVIYVTSSKRIAENIVTAAAEVDFDRFDVVPMINNDGIVPNGTSHWYL